MTNEQKWKLIDQESKKHKRGLISFDVFMSFVSEIVKDDSQDQVVLSRSDIVDMCTDYTSL